MAEYGRSKKFFRGRFIIAEYDDKDVLLNIYDNIDELAKYKKLNLKSAWSYLYRYLHRDNCEGGNLYLVDMLGFVNDDFYQADINTIQRYLEEVGEYVETK